MNSDKNHCLWTMSFKLFGGLDCADNLLARLAVVADLNAAIATKMAEHVVTILLLEPHSDKSEKGNTFTRDDNTLVTVGAGMISTTTSSSSSSLLLHASVSPPNLLTGNDEKPQQQQHYQVHQTEQNELDMHNQLFFKQPEMVKLGEAKVAQALTAIHTIATNMIRFDVSHNDAVEELTVLGLDEEVALAIVASVHAHRHSIAMILLDQTPLLSFANFALPYNDKTVKCPIVQNETSFGIRAFLYDQNGLAGGRRLFNIQRCKEEMDQKSESSAEMMVVWKVRDGIEIHIPIQKARALFAELVIAREMLRRAWRPYEVE
ncbi:uncharacterized protein TM35_000311280 [Trypanosoma theileri]|uniref:Uncharacterized protein n=1 Tax=Trypanosoma theileri TaxID=67003 RepID=A0A1X0NMH3_9TRYP|nr:uncharacterized protein TM35_000311280 [Trypanosoma theileri]ORC85942.1 hypothetical protein TM35_000311280 [Trypanosoma theileri]